MLAGKKEQKEAQTTEEKEAWAGLAPGTAEDERRGK